MKKLLFLLSVACLAVKCFASAPIISVSNTEVNQYCSQIGVSTSNSEQEAINNLLYIKLLDYVGMQKGYENSQEYVTGMTAQKDQILVQVATQKYILDAISITNQDIKNAYALQKSQMIIPQKDIVSHIVVETQSQAQAIITELKGKSGTELDTAFAAIANSNSLDTQTAYKGGMIGTYTEKDANGVYKTAIFSMKSPGVYPKPVKLLNQWSVIKVDQIIPIQTMSLEQATPILKQQLQQQHYSQQMQTWKATTLKSLGSENETNIREFISGKLVLTSGSSTIFATINGQNVTGQDIISTVALLLQQQNQQEVSMSDALQFINKSIPKVRKQIVNQVVLNKMLIEQAKKDDLQNSEQYNQIYSMISNQVLAVVTQQKEIIDKITVSDEQAQSVYNQYASQINQPFKQVRMQIIQMIQSQEAPDAMQQWFKTNEAKYGSLISVEVSQPSGSAGLNGALSNGSDN